MVIRLSGQDEKKRQDLNAKNVEMQGIKNILRPNVMRSMQNAKRNITQVISAKPLHQTLSVTTKYLLTTMNACLPLRMASAKSAESIKTRCQGVLMSIIAMLPGRFVGCSVSNATADLVCFKTVSKILNQQSGTFLKDKKPRIKSHGDNKTLL